MKNKNIDKEYSNGDVNRAGFVLAGLSDKISEEKSFEILKDFRVLHIKPIWTFKKNLERKLKEMSDTNEYLISQRLKRIPSIIQKIKNQEKMNLSRMHDIAGLRVVVDDNKKVFDLNRRLIESENKPNFKSTRKKFYDYIDKPKKSGYRGIHVRYQYKHEETGKLLNVEIQIRTQIQHSWATAVEIMEFFTKKPLKQSKGPKDILELFKKISKLFEIFEEGKTDSALAYEVEKKVIDYKLYEKLKGLSVASEKIIDNKGRKKVKYFLIVLNLSKRVLSVEGFTKKQSEVANNKYIKLEKEYKKDNFMDIVLVSVDSIKELKTMYPNYYLDSDIFIENLKNILSKMKKEEGFFSKIKKIIK